MSQSGLSKLAKGLQALLAAPTINSPGVVKSLQALAGVKVTSDLLKQTGLGLLVNKVRKETSISADAKAEATKLVKSWKQAVREEQKAADSSDDGSKVGGGNEESPQGKKAGKGKKRKQAPKKEESDEESEEEAKPKKRKPAAKSDSKMPGTGNILPPPEAIIPAKSFSTGVVLRERIRILKQGEAAQAAGPVMYWMSRDQRAQDNWALLLARHLGSLGDDAQGVLVVFNLVTCFRGAGRRHYDFMLKGLKDVEQDLKAANIPFLMTFGDPAACLGQLSSKLACSAVVTDYSPLSISRQWKRELAEALPANTPLYEVDAHNVVPVWVASDRQEWAAATFRKRITPHFTKFLQKELPALPPQAAALCSKLAGKAEKVLSQASKGNSKGAAASLIAGSGSAKAGVDWQVVAKQLNETGVDESVKPVRGIKPGREAAEKQLRLFESKLNEYGLGRNLPDRNLLSHMSPYLHYGTIAPHKVALAALKLKPKGGAWAASADSFFEELVVRRELSDNYCHFNARHNEYASVPPWVAITHKAHADDKRAYIYTEKQLEEGKTHDDLWNACQLEMVYGGKMHGYVRMYWAKKILEWTETAQEALEIAIRLNDKYELDGRDPNGIVGCLWAICGVHDRAWTERPIFGHGFLKIRFMNYAGCKRKFNIPAYIARVSALKRAEAEPQTKAVSSAKGKPGKKM